MEERTLYLLYWLTLLSVRHVGMRSARALLAKVPLWQDAVLLTVEQWCEVGVSADLAAGLVAAFASDQQTEVLKMLADRGTKFVSDREAEYPSLLREISYAPPFIFFDGTLPTSEHTCVAVVGTRLCTGYGRKAAFSLAQELAAMGITVVSGLAYGVDKAAHEGALAASGKTIAVLGAGIDCVYPPKHDELAKAIVQAGGCVMSEFLPWTGPQKHQFPKRNRIISGLSRAVVVIEAGAKSGSLITAAYALEQNREVLALPGSIFSDKSTGANELLAAGAAPLLGVHSVLDAISFVLKGKSLAPESLKISGVTTERLQVSEGAKRILQELHAGAMSLSELQLITEAEGQGIELLYSWLTELELSALVVRTDGRYSVR